jgi:hypothetical protein
MHARSGCFIATVKADASAKSTTTPSTVGRHSSSSTITATPAHEPPLSCLIFLRASSTNYYPIYNTKNMQYKKLWLLQRIIT